MSCGDLTDTQWERLEPLLPPISRMGRPPRDRRQVFDGIWWRARTGSPWRDVPERYGPWETAYTVFRRWQIDGTWPRILKKLQVKADADGIIEWEVSVDSTVCRAHQHAAGARKGADDSGRTRSDGLAAEPDNHGLGRSRGGLTTKIHLAVDASFHVLAAVITAGQRGDAPVFEQVMDKIRIPVPAADVRAPDRTMCSPTAPTPPARSAPTCADDRSRTPSRRSATKPDTGSAEARPVAARPVSTARRTSAGTRSNVGSAF